MALAACAKAGTVLRFQVDGVDKVGYVTSKDDLTGTMRVCTGTGQYYTVDRCLADAV